MKNYDDYRLEDEEAKAVERSRNLKIGALAGAGALGVAGAAAAATQLSADDDSELTADDLISGAEAGVEDITPGEEEAVEAQADEPEVAEVHHHHVHHVEKPVFVPEPEPDLRINETNVLYDENGRMIGIVDEGTLNGVDVAFIDSNGNGKADQVWYDENGDHMAQAHEIHDMDDRSYNMFQGHDLHAYQYDQYGNLREVGIENQMAFAEPDLPSTPAVDDISNDFRDEKTGEYYTDDVAHNNSDYNNHGGEQYSAGLESSPVSEPMYDESLAYNDSVQSAGYEAPVNDTPYYEEPAHDVASYDTPAYEAPVDHGYAEPLAQNYADTNIDSGMDFHASDDMTVADA